MSTRPATTRRHRRTRTHTRSGQAHIIDIENLLGANHAIATVDEIRSVVARYDEAVGFRPGELRHVGVNPSDLAFRVREAIGPCSLRCLRGTDGGETAVLSVLDTRCLSQRARVVIGSGDGAFTPLVIDLRNDGVEVVVAARRGSLNRHLREAADHVRFID